MKTGTNMAHIFAFREDRLGFSYKLGEKTIIGRAPECDLLIFDRSSSRHQAEIFKVDDSFYIADLNSTNGTLLNDKPVTIQTRLEPFDTIKIGMEVFIFEPGMQVVVGPAPSALIIESLIEEVHDLITSSAEAAAQAVDPEDVPALMSLAHTMGRLADAESLEYVITAYLHQRFGSTFLSVLWPSRPPAKRLFSLITSHDDKRLLLSHTPFIRATRDNEVLLWPTTITELSFSEGQRHVSTANSPALVGPLAAEGSQAGLLYLENKDRRFTEKDLRTFAALLVIVGPAIRWLTEVRSRPIELEYTSFPVNEFIASSNDTSVKITFSTATEAAAGSKSILLSGEAGTGKSAMAEYIHSASLRKNGHLVTVNLATLPSAEIETALFGQLDSGTSESRTGLVELADGGTLYLRHVEYLSPAAQKMLMMTVEEGIFFPLGSSRAKAVDLRVISSTFVDLWSRVQNGDFREDLYLRLNGLNISMPPLRAIRQDMDSLVNNFMVRAAREMGINFNSIDPAALECLRAYNWPGNFTELRMMANLLVLFSRNGRVAMEDLPAHLRMAPDTFIGDEGALPPPLIHEAERYQLIAAMARCEGDLEEVAALLNQRPEHIIMKMRALNLDPINYQPPIERAINRPVR